MWFPKLGMPAGSSTGSGQPFGDAPWHPPSCSIPCRGRGRGGGICSCLSQARGHESCLSSTARSSATFWWHSLFRVKGRRLRCSSFIVLCFLSGTGTLLPRSAQLWSWSSPLKVNTAAKASVKVLGKRKGNEKRPCSQAQTGTGSTCRDEWCLGQGPCMGPDSSRCPPFPLHPVGSVLPSHRAVLCLHTRLFRQRQLVPSCNGKGRPWATARQSQENRLTSAEPRRRSRPCAATQRGCRCSPGHGMVQPPHHASHRAAGQRPSFLPFSLRFRCSRFLVPLHTTKPQ